MALLPIPFEIQSRKIDTGETMLTVLGEIDMATAPQLARALGRCKGRTVVDLRKVPFMDSSGIRVLVAEQERLAGNGGSLRLLAGRGEVTRILELTGLTDTLQIDDAVSPVRAEEPSV
jgi:anti-anti-sigma factor